MFFSFNAVIVRLLVQVKSASVHVCHKQAQEYDIAVTHSDFVLSNVTRMWWQVENVECMPDDHIKFDFLGKDSIRYENEVVVHPKVYQLIEKFCQQFANKKGEFAPFAAGTV